MRPTIAQIQTKVAEHYHLPRRVMLDRSLIWGHSHPRQVAMALAVRLTPHSVSRVGHFFGGRDPTTVRHAVKQVRKRCCDPAKRSELLALARIVLRECRA